MTGDIIKLEYKKEFFDIEHFRIGRKTIVTITEDGIITSKEYKYGCRKAYSIAKEKCCIKEYRNLCQKIEKCIETADRETFYVDDSCETLKIFHQFGRTQSMDRGLGNEHTDIGCIMNVFIDDFLP